MGHQPAADGALKNLCAISAHAVHTVIEHQHFLTVLEFDTLDQSLKFLDLFPGQLAAEEMFINEDGDFPV